MKQNGTVYNGTEALLLFVFLTTETLKVFLGHANANTKHCPDTKPANSSEKLKTVSATVRLSPFTFEALWWFVTSPELYF